MTESSYFWNGATLGDAQLAPYTAKAYTHLLALLHTSKIPVILDEYSTSDGFSVTPNAGMDIDVAAGKAFIDGTFISYSGDTLTVASNTSGMDRLDRVIIRVDYPNKTYTVLLKTGTPSVVPQPPDLVQISGDIYEMSVARVYVSSGLAAITTSHLIDEREILESSSNAYNYANENILPNSEFMASAGTGGSSPGTTYSPTYWTLTGCECYVDTKFEQMVRGTTVRVECTAGSIQSLSTRMVVTNQNTVPVTIRFLIEVLSGYVMVDTIPVVADTQGLIIPPTNGPIEVIIRTEFNAADPELDFSVGNYDSGACSFKLGQVTVAYGVTGASYGSVRETLFFGNPVAQTGFTLSDSITGPGVFDVSYNMQEDEIARGSTHVLAHLAARDTASGGGACLVSIYGLWGLDITSLTNSALRSNHSFIPLRPNSTLDTGDPPRIAVSVQARGTMNVAINYIGLDT